MGVYLYSNEWSPWENTVAYYPLNSTTTINDQSWNNKNLTNSWVTFWTYKWVDCAYFDGSKYLYNNTSYWVSGSITTTAWVYFVSRGSSSTSNPRFYGNNSWNIWIWVNWNRTVGYSGAGDTSYQLTSDAWWLLLTLTYDGVSPKLYANWSLINSATVTVNYQDTNLWIGKYTVSWSHYWKGGVSEFIMEKWAWSSENILQHYNNTKSKYWIS